MSQKRKHSSMAYSSCACLQVTVVDTIRMLFVSFFGNFAGTAIMVGLFVAANTYEGKDGYLIYSAHKKVGFLFETEA